MQMVDVFDLIGRRNNELYVRYSEILKLAEPNGYAFHFLESTAKRTILQLEMIEDARLLQEFSPN